MSKQQASVDVLTGNKFKISEEDRVLVSRFIDIDYPIEIDWNLLMPVVEKIQSIDITPPPNYEWYRIEIVVQGYVKIEGFPMPTIMKNVSICGGLINAIWQAVVQFITWYKNTQTKKQ